MALSRSINKAKLRQRAVSGMVMQAAPDRPPSINTHLTPRTNLSHFIGKNEGFSSATANAKSIVPRQLVYIYTPAPMAEESSPMMMKEDKPKKGIK